MASRKLALAAIGMALAPVAIAAPTGGPTARIEAYDAAIVTILKQKLPMKARADQFQGLVNSYYDMPAIAARVIGPGWATNSAADRAAVTSALARHSAISLARNFKTFGGERFTVDPAAQARGDSMIVKVTITSSGSDILYFQLHQARGDWSIVDVISGGVSQAAVQRADLAGTAASGGAAAVAKRLAQLDAKAGG